MDKFIVFVLAIETLNKWCLEMAAAIIMWLYVFLPFTHFINLNWRKVINMFYIFVSHIEKRSNNNSQYFILRSESAALKVFRTSQNGIWLFNFFVYGLKKLIDYFEYDHLLDVRLPNMGIVIVNWKASTTSGPLMPSLPRSPVNRNLSQSFTFKFNVRVHCVGFWRICFHFNFTGQLVLFVSISLFVCLLKYFCLSLNQLFRFLCCILRVLCYRIFGKTPSSHSTSH